MLKETFQWPATVKARYFKVDQHISGKKMQTKKKRSKNTNKNGVHNTYKKKKRVKSKEFDPDF